MVKLLRIVVLALALCICSRQIVLAQSYPNADKELTFVYISHDVNTPVQALCDRLSDLYGDAKDYPDDRAVIFYLANGTRPLVCKMNVADANPGEFRTIMSELQKKRAHDIDPNTDIEEIQKIFATVDVINDEGAPQFRSFAWIWYLDSTFWELEYNKTIFGPLYYIFDMEPMIESRYLSLSIFHGEDDPLPLDETMPFGSLYSSIDIKNIPLMPY